MSKSYAAKAVCPVAESGKGGTRLESRRVGTGPERAPRRFLPRDAAEGIRNALRVFGAFVPLVLTLIPSAAAGAEIRATYDLTFAGFTIAKADVRVAIRGAIYTVYASYGTSGAAKLMGSANGEAASTGTFNNGRLVPKTFNLDHQGSNRTQKVELAMSEGSVNAMTIDPPVARGAPGAPVTGEHLKNVTDPLSALFLPARGKEGPNEFGVCNRTVPIFDGLRRLDIVLKGKGTKSASQGPYVGVLAVCEIHVTHIAGQTRDESRKSVRPLHAAEVSFGVLGEHDIHVPVSFSAKTGYMIIEARLTHLSSSELR